MEDMHRFCSIYLVLIFTVIAHAQVTDQIPSYYAFPQTFKTWDYSVALGLSVTKLPVHIVEDEINTSSQVSSFSVPVTADDA